MICIYVLLDLRRGATVLLNWSFIYKFQDTHC